MSYGWSHGFGAGMCIFLGKLLIHFRLFVDQLRELHRLLESPKLYLASAHHHAGCLSGDSFQHSITKDTTDQFHFPLLNVFPMVSTKEKCSHGNARQCMASGSHSSLRGVAKLKTLGSILESMHWRRKCLWKTPCCFMCYGITV